MVKDFSAIRQLYHIDDNYGFSHDDILAYKKVCQNLPNVLVDYYQQLGKCEFNQCQDNLLAPNELRLSQNQQSLISYQENQLACVWAIAVNNLAKDNPPVYISYDEKFATENWQIESDMLSDFLTTIAHLQAVFALPYYCEDFLFICDDELSFIEENFSKKPYQLTYWTNAKFYGNRADDVIYVCKNGNGYDLTYASFAENQFEKLDEILGNLGE